MGSVHLRTGGFWKEGPGSNGCEHGAFDLVNRRTCAIRRASTRQRALRGNGLEEDEQETKVQYVVRHWE